MGEDRELRCVPVLGHSPLGHVAAVIHADGLNVSMYTGSKSHGWAQLQLPEEVSGAAHWSCTEMSIGEGI